MKRFYRGATVEKAAEAAGFAVLLDDRPVRTPARRTLAIPSKRLAESIASEWNAQGEEIDPATMPLMQLAASALDRVAPQRADILDQLARYAETDLVCYRARSPADLVARQTAAWQPLADWVMRRFDAPLVMTTDVAPVAQPESTLAGLRAAIDTHDDFELAALGLATQACGSLVIGLALSHGEVDAQKAGDASQIDEIYQAEQWGEDSEAALRRAALRSDIESAARFLSAHRTP